MIDTSNQFEVVRCPTVSGEMFNVRKPPIWAMTREKALNLAAWIVALADPEGKDFPAILKEIKR